MSSLTDIIFLLLIFFMLTSNFVQIRPFDLPQSDSQTVAPTNIVVELEKSGALRVNNIEVSEASVLAALGDALEQTNNQADATVTIVAENRRTLQPHHAHHEPGRPAPGPGHHCHSTPAGITQSTMALQKRSKVSAEFNMSSLTDIIFLLLIFFMLTSTVVAPNALNLKLPGRADTPTSPSTERLDEVRIDEGGGFFF